MSVLVWIILITVACSWANYIWKVIATRDGAETTAHFGPLLWTILLFSLAGLQGCSSVTPYAAARHIDPTPFDSGSKDAWDVGCLGLKKRGQLQLKGGYCLNARGGNMLEASIEYDLFGEDR